MALLLAPEIIEGTALLAEGTEAGAVAEGTAGASSGGILSGLTNIITSPMKLLGGLFTGQLISDTLQGGDELKQISHLPSQLLTTTGTALNVLSNPLIMGGLGVLLVVLLLRR